MIELGIVIDENINTLDSSEVKSTNHKEQDIIKSVENSQLSEDNKDQKNESEQNDDQESIESVSFISQPLKTKPLKTKKESA